MREHRRKKSRIDEFEGRHGHKRCGYALMCESAGAIDELEDDTEE